MPDGKPTKAPIIIFGTMLLMSIVTVVLVFVEHSKRSEPYMQSKLRRVRHVSVAKSDTLSLNYVAFGPAETARRIIGKPWWQWQDQDDPTQRYDIKVVVYQHSSPEQLLASFPVIKEKRMDSRYLKYDTAIQYLDEELGKQLTPQVTTTLTETRAKLIKHFAP